MKSCGVYLKILCVCAAYAFTSACSSPEEKDGKIVLGTPSVISEIQPVTTEPVKVEELDITATSPAAQSEQTPPTPPSPAPAAQPAQPPAETTRPAPQPPAPAPATAQKNKTSKKYTFGRRYAAFKQESAELTDKAKNDLLDFISQLKNTSYIMIYIGAHTDSTGDEQENIALSEQRAQAVSDFLVSNGVPKEKITAKGYGSKYPAVPNTSARNRARNRRIDIEVF